MYDYIQIGPWRSDGVTGLHVMDWEAPVLPRAQRQASPLSGRMTAPEDARRDWRPENIPVTLAMVGTSRADIRQRMRPVTRTLLDARHLILSDMPGHHYRGHTAEVRPLEDYEEWLKVRMTFVANPPCALRTLGPQAGWIPDPALPPAEQITELNATHNLALSGPASVAIGDGLTAYPPEIHMLLLGSWDTLTINDLTIPGLPVTSAVYLDSEAMQVWDKVDGVRTPVPNLTGNYDTIGAGGQLVFGGTNVNATAHILVIERS